MPFHLYGRGLANAPDACFSEVDQRIIQDVLPNLNWQEEPKNWKRIVIAPNSKVIKDNRSSHYYFLTTCKSTGLLICDIGLWLDRCLSEQFVVHADTIRRRWHTNKESLPRFNQCKHIYFFGGTASRYLWCREEL